MKTTPIIEKSKPLDPVRTFLPNLNIYYLAPLRSDFSVPEKHERDYPHGYLEVDGIKKGLASQGLIDFIHLKRKVDSIAKTNELACILEYMQIAAKFAHPMDKDFFIPAKKAASGTDALEPAINGDVYRLEIEETRKKMSKMLQIPQDILFPGYYPTLPELYWPTTIPYQTFTVPTITISTGTTAGTNLPTTTFTSAFVKVDK